MKLKKLHFSVGDWALLVLCLFISSWYVLPAVKVLVPSTIITLIGILFLVSTVFDNKKGQNNLIRLLIAFFLLFSLYYFYTFAGSISKSTGIVSQMIVSLTPALVLYRVRKNEKITNLFFVVISLMLIYVIITTLFEFVANPGIARVLAHSEVDGISTDSIRLRNIGGFGHAYGLVFVLLALSFRYRKAGSFTRKLLILFLIIVGMWYIYMAEYFLALVLVLVGILLSYLVETKNMGIKVLLVGISIVLLLFLPSLFEGLSAITQGTISRKFLEISLSMKLGSVEGASVLARENAYLMSLQSFISSPIWGVKGSSEMYGMIGGHSTILDFLGQTGIIGFGAYCMFLVYNYKTINYKCKEYNLIFFFYVFLSLLNPTMSFYEISAFIFLIVPLLLEYESPIKGEKTWSS